MRVRKSASADVWRFPGTCMSSGLYLVIWRQNSSIRGSNFDRSVVVRSGPSDFGLFLRWNWASECTLFLVRTPRLRRVLLSQLQNSSLRNHLEIWRCSSRVRLIEVRLGSLWHYEQEIQMTWRSLLVVERHSVELFPSTAWFPGRAADARARWEEWISPNWFTIPIPTIPKNRLMTLQGTRNWSMVFISHGPFVHTYRKSLGTRWEPTTYSTHIWHRAGIELEPHWRKASALTNALSLLPPYENSSTRPWGFGTGKITQWTRTLFRVQRKSCQVAWS